MVEEAEEAEAAGILTPVVQGSLISTSEYTTSERGDNDFKGSDRWGDKYDGDREHKKDRFHDDEKQGSYKDSGYKSKNYDDDDFKGRPYPKRDYNDPLQSPALPVERSGVMKTRGGGGNLFSIRNQACISQYHSRIRNSSLAA